MTLRRLFLTLPLLILAGAPASGAEFEITPTVGYRFGTAALEGAEACIAGGCPGADTAEDVTYGLALGLALNERWLIELRASRQDAELDFDTIVCPFCGVAPPQGRLEQTTLLLGLERRFPLDRFEPFLALGAGLTRLETTDDRFLPFNQISEDRPTISLATGLRLPLSSLLSLRLEARGLYTTLPSDIARDDLVQLELSTGLTFRF